MSERAALIKLGVNNGVTNLKDIQSTYNQYAEGGNLKDSGEDSSVNFMTKANGGFLNEYKEGGYKPSDKIKKRISTWEGSSMKTNRPFEAEALDFNRALPAGATSKLSQEQLDGLYSYSYNVGAGNFRKRVSPVLQRYLAGQAAIQDVQRSMWASKDSQLRGLANRRAIEREMFGNNGIQRISDTITNMKIAGLPSEYDYPLASQEVSLTQPVSIDSYRPVDVPNDIEEPTISPLVGVLSLLQNVKSDDYYTPNHYNVRI